METITNKDLRFLRLMQIQSGLTKYGEDKYIDSLKDGRHAVSVMNEDAVVFDCYSTAIDEFNLL